MKMRRGNQGARQRVTRGALACALCLFIGLAQGRIVSAQEQSGAAEDFEQEDVPEEPFLDELLWEDPLIMEETTQPEAQAEGAKDQQDGLITDLSEEGKEQTRLLAEDSPAETVHYQQMNPIAAAYIREVSYTDDDCATTRMWDYTQIEGSWNADRPAGYTIVCAGGDTIRIYDQELGGALFLEDTFTEDTYTIFNLIPGHCYDYIVTDPLDLVVEEGSLCPEGQVRMIRLEGSRNVRDLGGWQADGGRVRYGLIYRGAALWTADGGMSVTAGDQETLSRLGIRTEIDLRWSHELTSKTGERICTSSIPGAQYVNIPLQGYYRCIDPLYKEMQWEGNCDNTAAVLRQIMTDVISGKPVYFHCHAGADRTGTVAFMLEGLLGVGQSDMDKDFELTSFYSHRYRNNMDNNEYNWYPELISFVKTLRGNTLQDKIIHWYLDRGFTYDELNAFRGAMIAGHPALLTPDQEMTEQTSSESEPSTEQETSKESEPSSEQETEAGQGTQTRTPEETPPATKQDTSAKQFIAKARITVVKRTYTGKAVKSPVGVWLQGKQLKAGRDYTASFSHCKQVGRARVAVSGKGAYTGTKVKYYSILPRRPGSVRVIRKKPGLWQIRWKGRKEASGYQLQYQVGKQKKVLNLKGRGGTRGKGITAQLRLVVGGRVKMRLRSYTKRGGATYYSAWSPEG